MNATTIRFHHPLARGAEIAVSELWSFPEGLIGLPDFRRFARIPVENGDPFEILCAVEDPGFGIVVVEPRVFVPDYVLGLPPEELRPLGDCDPASIEIRVPVVLPGDDEPLALNLKGPILFATLARTGVQRISPEEGHPVRFLPRATGTDATPCSS